MHSSPYSYSLALVRSHSHATNLPPRTFILARLSSVWRRSSSLAPRPPRGADEPPRRRAALYIVSLDRSCNSAVLSAL